MLILLPPSEGKATASHPELNPARERVLDALVSLCAGADADADTGPARTALVCSY